MKKNETESTGVSPGDIEEIIRELLSPPPISSPKELENLIKPLPVFIGPGEWLKLLK